MAKTYSKYKGVALYDNFDFNSAAFGVSIMVQIDPIQYWRDRPLFLGYKDGVYAEAIRQNKAPEDYAELPDVKLYLEALSEVNTGLGTYEHEAQRIQDLINQYAVLQTGENLDIDYPSILPEPEVIEIKDADGNVIDTIQIDLTERNIKPTITDTGPGSIPITFRDRLPADYGDDQRRAGLDTATIATLPDSYIKDKLWISDEILPAFNAELAEAGIDLRRSFDPFLEIAPDAPDLEPTKDYIDQLEKPIEMWYGIPLITLSSRDTEVKDSYILHLNTKENWTLDVTNIVGSGLDNQVIRLDKTIPPGKKFTAGLTLELQRLTIYLQIEGDDELYTSSVLLIDIPDVQLTSYGSDNEGLKTICGYIWDIKYWDTSDLITDRPGLPRPGNPGGGVFYPGDGGSGTGGSGGGSIIRPEGNWNNPAYGGGQFLDLDDNFRFVFNSYMDRFFCRSNLQNTSFTIGWYQYQLGYSAGLKTLVADNIHSNYIRYDYDTFEIVIDFNNFHYRERIMLPEFMWLQFSVRYNIETNELVIGFRDFFWDRYEEVKVNIGPGLEFELMSLWGRFSENDGRYLEVQRGVFGMVMVNTESFSDEKLKDVYDEHKLFLNQYNPRLLELPGEV